MGLSTLLAVYLNHKMTQRLHRFQPGSAERKVRSRRKWPKLKSPALKEEL
ncbi:hypothetical protein [Paenibacillus sp.]